MKSTPVDSAPQAPPAFFAHRGLTYREWYIRERTAGRHTKPGPQSFNSGITPSGYDHRPPRRPSFAWRRVYGSLLGAVGGAI